MRLVVLCKENNRVVLEKWQKTRRPSLDKFRGSKETHSWCLQDYMIRCTNMYLSDEDRWEELTVLSVIFGFFCWHSLSKSSANAQYQVFQRAMS